MDTILIEDISNITTDLINFSPVKHNHIREQTARDAILSSLVELIYAGWPEVRNELPTNLREFLSYWNELTIENGVIFKGCQVLIP